MVFGKFISGKDDLRQVQEIRQKVFAEELGLTMLGEMPDEFCMHALAYEGEQPVGMGRIMYDGDRFTIAGIAVLPEYRGQKYGDFLARLLIDKAMMSNAQEIYLDALSGTESFFGKLGFEVCGAEYDNLGGSWIPMILHTDQIHKCCNCKG
ncbi:MAG: GNAT family N-acetyltransferase [Eubacterium sp.]